MVAQSRDIAPRGHVSDPAPVGGKSRFRLFFSPRIMKEKGLYELNCPEMVPKFVPLQCFSPYIIRK